jgi:hypothetical protein
MVHIEDLKGASAETAPDAIRTAAASAYERRVNYAPPPEQQTPPEGALPPELQKDIDAVLLSAREDGKNGKFSPEGKKAWQDLVDYLKKDQPAGNQLASALNAVGSGVNDILESDGSKNRIGLSAVADSNGINYYMMMNGPTINKDQNHLDVMQGHESGTVIQAGRLERPKPAAKPAP